MFCWRNTKDRRIHILPLELNPCNLCCDSFLFGHKLWGKRAPSDVEAMGEGWLWTTGTDTAKSLNQIALCECELVGEYQCYRPGAHTAAVTRAVTSATQEQDSKKSTGHPCSHLLCRANLPAGKCPSTTKEERHGSCSRGLHPQWEALTPEMLSSAALQADETLLPPAKARWVGPCLSSGGVNCLPKPPGSIASGFWGFLLILWLE